MYCRFKLHKSTELKTFSAFLTPHLLSSQSPIHPSLISPVILRKTVGFVTDTICQSNRENNKTVGACPYPKQETDTEKTRSFITEKKCHISFNSGCNSGRDQILVGKHLLKYVIRRKKDVLYDDSMRLPKKYVVE